MRFIAFDLETTGTVPNADSIVEIGAVRFVDGQVDSVFSTLINPGRPMPAGASRVNGIFDEMLIGKPTIESILPAFTDFVGNDFLIAHNAPFDASFLISDYKKYELLTPPSAILDTLPIARKVFPGLPNYKLGTLVQMLKIDASGFHRAEADSTYCGKLFLEMLKRISVNSKSPSFENLVALTGKPEFRFPVIEKKPKQMSLFA